MKNNIRVERAIKNITQEDLSRLAQVSRQTINAIESGKYVPSTLLSLKISRIFDKSVNDIFQLEESDWKES
ncbi:MAG: helix-turn-helix transcriptional regulator [Bacteroidia bacterium]|nr:helix-turn-helix transcriptional regulator [Bacteroidia bacterium]